MKFRLFTVITSLILISVYTVSALSAGQGSAAADITVTNAYARAVAPGQKNSAIFMTLNNQGQQQHALSGASGDIAQSIELHTHIDDGGIMRMRPIDKITIPANGSTELKSGGMHIMLIGLKKTLQEGDEVAIRLQFEDGSSSALTVPVKAIMPMGRAPATNHTMQEHKHNM